MSGFKNIQVLLTADSGNLKSVLTQASRQVNQFERDVQSAGRGTAAAGTILKTGLAAGAVAAGVGLAYAATKAVEFDKSMRNVNSLTKLNEAGFQAMEARVIGMSRTLPQSAKTLADGLYDIASSGFQGADGMKVLDAAAKSASAGLTTTAVSAKAITSVLNAYGREASDATDISDVLFQTVNLGVISFEELAGNLGDVVGGAAAAKVSIDQVGSAIATMTLAGIGGAESTTSLNQLFAKLVQPSDALAEVYKKLGYESGASALKTKGLHGVMEDLRKATGGNIESLLALFPEIRAARGALALMANEGKNYNKVSAEIEDKNKRQGATMATLHEQMKAVSNQWQLFKNGVDASAISLGTRLLPILLDAMNGARDFGEAAGDVLQRLEPLKDAAEAVGRAVMELGGFLGPTAEALGKLAGAAIIGAILALGRAIEVTANFMADHEQLVTTLAIAYGVKLLGAMIAARGGLSVMAWEAMSTVIVGLTGKIEGAEGAFNGLKVAQAAATLGIAILIGEGIAAWNGYTNAAEEATDAVKAFNSVGARGQGIDAMVSKLDDATEKMRAIEAKVQETRSKTVLGQLIDPKDTYAAAKLVSELDKVTEAHQHAQEAVGHVRENTVRYLTDSTQLGGKAFDKWLTPMLRDTGKLDGEVAKLQERAKAAGTDLSQPYDVVKAALDRYAASQASTATAEQNVIDAMAQMGNSATDTADQVDALKTALDRLLGIPMDMDAAADAFQQSLDDMTKTLKENGNTLDNNTQKGRDNKDAIRDSVQALREKIESEAKAGKSSAELSASLTKGISSIYKNADAVGFNKKALQGLLEQYNLTPELVQTIVTAIGTGKSEQEVKDLIKTMGGVKDKAATVIAKGAAKSRAEVKDLDAQIAVLKGKRVEATQYGATDGQKKVKELDRQIRILEGKRVNVGVNGADLSARQVSHLRQQIALLDSKTVTVKTRYTIEGKGGGGSTAADGGVFARFADGGQYRPAIGDQPPQISANRGPRGIQWAETGSGPWEAFISGHPGKRRRSIAILEEVAQRLDMQVTADDGQESFASGGIRRKKGETAAAYQKRVAAYRAAQAKAAQERRDAADARAAAYREQQRLLAIAQGRGENAYQGGFDTGGALDAFSSRAEASAQATAERRAMLSSNKSDSAADYYKAPVLTAKSLASALYNSSHAVEKWGADLSKVAKYAGADVAASLAAMGKDGQKYVAAMSKATVKDMQAMADAMRKLEFQTELSRVTADAKGQAAFKANLVALVKAGRSDLAAKFAEMGYDQAGSLAAAAVRATPAQQAALAAGYAAQGGGDNLQQALALAALLQGSHGALGVAGLARASGMGIADVLGLLTAHQGDVFGPLGAAAMRQVLIDQGLIASGRQPSGLAQGGIVLGGANRGLFYRWAEQGEGGESLIPLGQDKRGRAQALWQTTGRMIGMAPGQGAGAGGTYVTIAPGAVSVSVRVANTGATPGQIQQAATAAADRAMAGLADRLRAGRRR